MKQNNIKELSIQVNLNGLSFCILNRTSNTIEYLNSIEFVNKLTPSDALHRLKSELSANSVFSDDFNEVTVIHQNELSTLVPTSLYDESQKADYLKFNSKILKTDFITTDEVIVNNSINVYIPYVNINNYIFDTFGEFVYKHASTVLVDTILQYSSTKDRTEVFVNVNGNTIEVLVVENGKLLLINSFEFFSREDFIYYVLFVYEQLKLDPDTIPVSLIGMTVKDDELYNILYTYVRHVQIIESNYNLKFSDTVDTDNLHQHYLILNSF